MPKTSKNPAKPPRDRLLEAAKLRFHQRGINATTLADIAKTARIPTGNVYYHFRTKDELVEAVVANRAEELRGQFEAASLDPEPLERLMMLIRDARRNQAELTERGCPFAGIGRELQKVSGGKPTKLLEMYLEFATEQFSALGAAERSGELAEELICSLQGSYLLANQLGSSEFLERQLDRLEDWLLVTAASF